MQPQLPSKLFINIESMIDFQKGKKIRTFQRFQVIDKYTRQLIM